MKFLRKFFGNLIKTIDEREWTLLSGGSAGSMHSNKQVSNLYQNWAFVAIDKIAETISQTKFYLEHKKTGERVDQHPFLSFLQQPNPALTKSDFLYNATADLEIFGNYYAVYEVGEVRPKTIYTVQPNQVSVQTNNDLVRQKVQHYIVAGKNFDINEVIHVKYPNPFSMLVGVGPMMYVISWLSNESESSRLRTQFFKNGGLLHGIIETEEEIADQLTLIRRNFDTNYVGQGKEFKTAVLPKGSKYKPISSLKDIELGQDDANIRDKILAAFGVPKSVLGITEQGSSKADADAKNYAFMVTTIKPKIERLRVALERQVLSRFIDGSNYYLKYEDPVPEDHERKIEEYKAGLAGQAYMSINEVRSKEGLPPIENGDSVLVTGFPSPLGKPIDVPEKSYNPYERIVKALKTPERKTYVKSDTLGMSEEQMEIEHKKFIENVTRYENEYIKRLGSVNETFLETAKETLKQNGYRDTKNALDDLSVNLGFTTEEYASAINVATSPILQELLQKEGNAAMTRVSTNPFNPLNDKLQDQLKDSLKLSATSYSETTFKLLEKELEKGVAEGDTLEQLTGRVDNVFGLNDLYRAEQIARDTVFGVANMAAREAYIQSEVVKTVRWHTAEDELVCPQCSVMNGKVVSVDKKWFNVGDSFTDANGKKVSVSYRDIGSPPLHSRCRCFELPEEITINV